MSLPVAEKKYLGRVDLKDLSYLKKSTPPFTCLSLFSGCGGAALGIHDAGFEVRAFVEWEKAACDTLRINWVGKEKTVKQKRDPAILNVDITKLSAEDLLKAADLRLGEATILEGGFPCQGFSFANSRHNNDDHTTDKRNLLYLELVRILRGTLPKTFMLENVPGLISMEKGKVIRMICNDLANSGYNVNWELLNAADYGVPQNRKRIFIIGERNDVLILKGDTPQFHIAGAVGSIKHPDWFLKKYPTQTQLSLFDELKK